ncbi:MAG: hypothetical protein GY841_02140 [FCB group bacterium]|nr:hypothetical protein [FCB group bacterium]
MHLRINNRLSGVFVAFMIVALCSQDATALTIRKKTNRRVVETSQPWSFQIALDENMEEDDFHGFRLSLARQYSSSAAIRFNLGFEGRDVNSGITSIHFTDGHVFEFQDDRDFDLTGVNLSIQFLAYPRPDGKVRFFWGAGPRLSINEAEPDNVFFYDHNFSFSGYDELYYNDFTRLGLGVEGTFGLEMFLGRNVSLLAELGFTLQNEWYLFEYDYYDDFGFLRSEVESFDDGVHFDGSRVKLGLAVYF